MIQKLEVDFNHKDTDFGLSGMVIRLPYSVNQDLPKGKEVIIYDPGDDNLAFKAVYVGHGAYSMYFEIIEKGQKVYKKYILRKKNIFIKRLICLILKHKLDHSKYIITEYTGQHSVYCNRCNYYIPLYDLN